MNSAAGNQIDIPDLHKSHITAYFYAAPQTEAFRLAVADFKGRDFPAVYYFLIDRGLYLIQSLQRDIAAVGLDCDDFI